MRIRQIDREVEEGRFSREWSRFRKGSQREVWGD
jgi:hypothetical protein